jgi:hypothetical protein
LQDVIFSAIVWLFFEKIKNRRFLEILIIIEAQWLLYLVEYFWILKINSWEYFAVIIKVCYSWFLWTSNFLINNLNIISLFWKVLLEQNC